jgi:hypothetical protein
MATIDEYDLFTAICELVRIACGGDPDLFRAFLERMAASLGGV